MAPNFDRASLIDQHVRGEHQATAIPARDRELNWMSTHPGEIAAHKGQWIVLEGDGILSADADYNVARDEATKAGVKCPFIFQVPEDDWADGFVGL